MPWTAIARNPWSFKKVKKTGRGKHSEKADMEEPGRPEQRKKERGRKRAWRMMERGAAEREKQASQQCLSP
jgi:hypothetical protein